MSILLSPKIAFKLGRDIDPHTGLVTWFAAFSPQGGREIYQGGFLERSQAWGWIYQKAHE